MNNTTRNSVQTPNISRTSKDVLARLLASENLIVEHSSDAATASFDTNARILTLPVWQDMSNSLYDMLVGHEVAHALWTPSDEWRDSMFLKGEAHAPIFKQIVNIVEDARIERMIKAKFPGLRRDFFAAYSDLADRDFFGLNDTTMDDLTVVDRLNLEFKIGSHTPIPFAADERVWIDRVATTKTFADVVAVSSDLFDLIAPELDSPQESPEQEETEEGEEGIGMPAPSDAAGGEDSDEDTEADGESGSSDAPEGDQQDDNNTTSMHDDTDDGESADSREIPSQAGSNGGIGSTMQSFEEAVNELRDMDAKEQVYADVPVANMDHIVIDSRKVHTTLFDYVKQSDRCRKSYNEAVRGLAQFENESKKTVNMMAQQFMRRQAADEQQRTSISQTGVLDTNKMINYKWSEDLFLRHEEIADGKNHGFVLFLDWSASMSGIIDETIQQLLQFAMFCRKVNVPFEVYAFTSQSWNDDDDLQYHDDAQSCWQQTDTSARVHGFHLMHLLSSTMNNRQMKTAMTNLFYVGTDRAYGGVPRQWHMGSTPLNETIVAAMDIIPAFRAANDLQIVNTIFLTDGDASSNIAPGHYRGKGYLRKGTKSYSCDDGGTAAALEMFKDTTGSKAIGIYLNDSKRLPHFCRHDSDELSAAYKKQGWIATSREGYTEYFVMKANTKVENDALEGLSNDVSYTRLKNAFMKASSGRVASRVVLNRVVDLMAV